eukprot:gene13621-biopygen345
MNSCHEEGVRDRNRAEIKAADPARSAGSAASIPARFHTCLFSASNSNSKDVITIPWWIPSPSAFTYVHFRCETLEIDRARGESPRKSVENADFRNAVMVSRD